MTVLFNSMGLFLYIKTAPSTQAIMLSSCGG
eukprot:CAMPEP_0170325008 /NCGR_PEP_ID=MMETSP0116_2-20130129/63361_1 /TAXON_ID=400756 /ORGANISM="Durinskia baltica, Strain CSIRO CS-38" /LENGTH=30 /DNA_ID= /DNA_START= /DNA_END= /DNA_ORIENTATION=